MNIITIILAVLISIFVLLSIVGLVLYLMAVSTVKAVRSVIEETTGEILSRGLKGTIQEVIKK